MFSSNTDRQHPFPAIPEEIKDKFAISNLFLRPFGWFEQDLNIDFNQKLRPYLETQILECCTRDSNCKRCDAFGATRRIDRNFFWELEIGKRTECLLILATLAGASELTVSFRCLNQACRQQMEINLTIEELIEIQQQSSQMELRVRIGNDSVAIRKPTGREQLQWLSQSFTDEKAAVQVMIQNLLAEHEKSRFLPAGIVPDEWVQAIDETMADLDPLVNFTLLVNCPYCETQNQHGLDLGELSLQRLHHAQENLLRSVHRLASHYHWSEAEVFAVPAWRRSRYLALIEKEENR